MKYSAAHKTMSWTKEQREKWMSKHPDYMKNYRKLHRSESSRYFKNRRHDHPLLNVYIGMMRRCGLYKGKTSLKRYYADRGITVCDEWKKSFDSFEKWSIAHGWKKGLQIDRIDNNRNYEPSNCRFVTPKENSQNRRNTRKIRTEHGEMPLIEFWRNSHSVVSYKTFVFRHEHGWSMIDALYIPARKCKKTA